MDRGRGGERTKGTPVRVRGSERCNQTTGKRGDERRGKTHRQQNKGAHTHARTHTRTHTHNYINNKVFKAYSVSRNWQSDSKTNGGPYLSQTQRLCVECFHK